MVVVVGAIPGRTYKCEFTVQCVYMYHDTQSKASFSFQFMTMQWYLGVQCEFVRWEFTKFGDWSYMYNVEAAWGLFIFLVKGVCTVVEASGNAPSPRTCHSMTSIGNKLYIFGGGLSGADPVQDKQIHVYDAGVFQLWRVFSFSCCHQNIFTIITLSHFTSWFKGIQE